MPATSKKQFKLIQVKRNKYKTKKKTPEKWQWIWEKGWIKGVDYDSLPDESVNESFSEFMKNKG